MSLRARTRPAFGDQYDIGDFIIQSMGNNYYRLIPDPTDGYFTLTGGGSADTYQANINFNYQLLRFNYEHNTDSIGTDSTENLSFIFERPTGSIPDLPYLQDRFWREEDITDARGGVDFSDMNLVFPAGRLDVIIETVTADYTVTMEIYLRRLTYAT